MLPQSGARGLFFTGKAVITSGRPHTAHNYD